MTKQPSQSPDDTTPASSDLTVNDPAKLAASQSLSALFGSALANFDGKAGYTVKEESPLLDLANQMASGSNAELSFRTVKASANASFVWNLPDSEIKEVGAVDILAVRGVIVSYGAGLLLYNSGDRKVLCQSIGMEPMRGEPVEGSMPFPIPLYGPQEYNKPLSPDRNLFDLNPQGARGESCIECVQRGHNVYSYIDSQGKQQTDSCSGNAAFFMVVTDLAVAKTNLAARKVEAVWTPVVDFVSPDGNRPYTAPFVLRVNLSTSVATKYSKQLPYEAYPASPVPSDAESWRSFLESMSTSVQELEGNRLQIAQSVEVWAAKPLAYNGKEPSQMIKSVPVFRPTPLEVVSEADTPYLVAVANHIFKQEWVAGGGKVDADGNPLKPKARSLPAEFGDVSAAPSPDATAAPMMKTVDVVPQAAVPNPFAATATASNAEGNGAPTVFSR